MKRNLYLLTINYHAPSPNIRSSDYLTNQGTMTPVRQTYLHHLHQYVDTETITPEMEDKEEEYINSCII